MPMIRAEQHNPPRQWIESNDDSNNDSDYDYDSNRANEKRGKQCHV